MSLEYDPSFSFDPTYARRSARVAYELEGQAIVVAQLQEKGYLSAGVDNLESLTLIEEEGLSWFVLQPGSVKLFAGDCNAERIGQLQEQKQFTIIEGYGKTRPDITFGREEVLVAAVFIGSGYENAVYVSPGFDLHRYRLLYDDDYEVE